MGVGGDFSVAGGKTEEIQNILEEILIKVKEICCDGHDNRTTDIQEAQNDTEGIKINNLEEETKQPEESHVGQQEETGKSDILISSKLEDKYCLKDASLSLDIEDMDEPFTGWNDDETDIIWDHIEGKAEIMFDIVLDIEHLSADVASIVAHKSPIVITLPPDPNWVPGGGEIKMRITNITPKFLEITNNEGGILEAECKNAIEGLSLQEDNFVEHLANNTSQDHCKEIFGVNPVENRRQKSEEAEDKAKEKNIKGKTKNISSRRSIQLPKRYAGEETLLYSAEQKMKKGNKIPKRVGDLSSGLMEMGMLPPEYPKGKEDSNSDASTPLSPLSPAVPIYKRRGRPPIPGGRKDLLLKAQELLADQEVEDTFEEIEDCDSTMFQISAFRQNQSFIDAALVYNEMQDQVEDVHFTNPGAESMENEEESSLDAFRENAGHQLPCSIKCQGAMGQFPTLQCQRCWCLYHPECLIIPPDGTLANFYCSNCKKTSFEIDKLEESTEGKKSLQTQRKGGAANNPLPPPPLIPIEFSRLPDKIIEMGARKAFPPSRPLPILTPIDFAEERKKFSKMPLLQPISSSGMSASPITMNKKRGRGRPPKIFPKFSRDLTVTLLPMPMTKKYPESKFAVDSSPHRLLKPKIKEPSDIAFVSRPGGRPPVRVPAPSRPKPFKKYLQGSVAIGRKKMITLPTVIDSASESYCANFSSTPSPATDTKEKEISNILLKTEILRRELI